VHLDQLGIRSGERVALSLTNSIEHFILLLGLLRLGATTMEMPYETAAPAAELLRQFAIRTIFLEPGVTPPAGVNTISFDIGWRDTIARLEGDRRHKGSGEEIFIINLTSGTTGVPRGSLNPHSRFFPRLALWAEPFAETSAFSSDRPASLLLTASLGFSVFFRHALGHLFIGGAVVILPEFRNVIDLVKAIADWDDALCYLPSAMCRFLIACAPPAGLLLPDLRLLIGGGGFLYPQEKLALLDRVTPRFYHSYGASGFGMLAVQSPSEIRERPASVGRPPSSIEVEVVDAHGLPLPAGTVGQLRARGTQGEAVGTDPRFRGEWYYPGDLGHVDSDGYLFLKGRDSEVIARNGGQVFAADIESVIALHPAVAEVAVVAIPRPFAADELVALVVAGAGGQHEALAAHCRAQLPPGQWPDRIFYAPALPKTAAGKVDRERVRNMIMTAADQQARG
jgi:long-chain acyl-CoA synthetase